MRNRLVIIVALLSLGIGVTILVYLFPPDFLIAIPLFSEHAIQIQHIDWTADKATIYVQNLGRGMVTLTEVYLDGNRVASPEGLGQLSEGSTATLTVSGTFTVGQTVEIKIFCEDDTFTLMTDTVQF